MVPAPATSSDGWRMWCSPVPAPPRDTRPGPAGARRAAGGRPGARVPGQGPTVGWAQPGLPGGFFPPGSPSTQPPERRSEVAQFTSVFSSNHRLACAVSRLSALEPSRRRPLEGPPRGQGRRVTGRPSPPRSKSRAALPDQQPASLTFPSPTSSSSGSMYDPNDVPDNISGARDDAPMEMKPLPTNVPQAPTNFPLYQIRRPTVCVGTPFVRILRSTQQPQLVPTGY